MNVYCIEFFYAKPQQKAKLLNALQGLVNPSRAEPGCLQYDLLADQQDPNLIILILKFVDQAAMSLHENQPYIKDFIENGMIYCDKLIWHDASEII